MRRLHWLTLASLGVLAACRQPDSALRVDVTIKGSGSARVRADCVKLAVLVNGEQTKSLIVPRPTDDTLVLGIVKTPDLPQTVSLQLSGLVGPSCTDETTLQLNARGPVLEATFPQSGVQPFAMELEPPGRSLDADGDNYVGANFGGPDCRDTDASIFPGATQVCTSQTDNDCDALVGCDDPGCSSAPFCQDQATKVVVTTPMNTMLRGACLGPIRVELQNDFGPRRAVRDTAVTFASSITGVTVHITATCTDAALTTVPILYDETSVDVYVKADETAFGTNTFTATADRVAMPGSVMIEVHPRPFTSAKFTSMPQTVTAGACGATPVTIELFDSQMRRTDVDLLTTINLTSNPGDLNNSNIFFSDPMCTTGAAQAVLMPGQGQVTLYLLARRAGSFTLTASPPTGVMGDTQMLTVGPSTATKLAFTNMEIALQTTVPCSSSTLDIEVQDQFGNPVTLMAEQALAINVMGPSPLEFFAFNNMCTVALSSYAIPAGSSRVQLRVKATMAGSMANAITVSAVAPPSPLMSATQNLYVSAGPASQYTWVGMPQQPLAGVCSAMPLTLQLLDSANNPSSVSTPVNFTLSATLGTPAQSPVDTTFRFYAGAGCQTEIMNNILVIPANTTQAQIYFRANKVRTNFEVRAAGTLTGPMTTSTGHSVLPNVPANLAFSTTNIAQTAAAGACSPNPYTVNVLDQYSNPTSFTSSQSMNITSSPTGVNVGLAPACAAGNAVTLAANATSTTFNATATRVPGGGTYQLSASVSTFSTTTPASLTVTPATAQLTSTPSGALTLAAGACQNISLVRQDMYMNLAPTSGSVNVGITFPAGAFDVFPQQDCNGTAGAPVPMNSASQVSFSVRAKQAGVHTLGLAAQGPTTSLSVTINPGTPILQFEAPATGTGMANATIQAGGCTTVTLARKDAFNNDVGLPSAQAMTFVTSDPSVTVHTAAGCNSPTTSISMAQNAARQTFYVKGTSTTMGWTVTATLATQSATLNLTVTPGTSMLSFVAPTGGTANVLANDCVVVTIERRDSQGNPVPIPGTVTTASIAPTGSISVFNNTMCSMPAITGTIPVTPGTSSKTFSVRSLTVGTPSLLITLDGQMLTLSLSVSPNTFTTLLLENVPATLTAGGCSAGIVVRRRDSFGNDITTDPGLTVNLTSSQFSFSSTPTTCAAPQTNVSVIIANGSAVSTDPVYLTSTVANPATVTATSTSPAAMVTANSTIVAAAPTQLVFTTPPSTVTVPGCGAALTIELRDTYGNRVAPASPYNVAVSSNLAAAFFPRMTCTAPAAASVSLTSANPIGTFSFQPTASGSHTITISGTSPTLSNTQMWTVNPGPAARLAWRTVPTAAPARFACVAAGVVESRDTNNNLTVVTADTTVTLVSSTPTLQFFSDAACTTPVTTTTIPNGQDVAPGLYMFATGGPASVTLTSVPSLFAPMAVTVTPGAPTGSLVVTAGSSNLEAGGCVALTVTRKDGGGADLSTGTTLATLATGASSVELHSNASCTALVTSPANLTFANGVASLSTLWAKGKSAPPATATTAATVTLTAQSTGSSNGTVNLTVYPLVRRGSCNFADTETTKRCVISASNPPFPAVDISRSFLVFSSNGRPINGNTVEATNQSVECHLDTNAGTSVDVVCTRAGGLQLMNVNYQVVSFGRDAASGQGISVQHFSQATSTSTATTNITLSPAVDAAKSFFLASNTYDGTLNNAEGFPLVRFPSTTGSQATIDVVSPTATPTGRIVSVQVVTLGWTGGVTNHTHSANPTVSSNNYDITTPMLSNSFPLVMATAADGTTADAMCKRKLNARATLSTNVRLHRGSPTQPAGCIADAVTAANVQRVLFPGQTSNVFDVNFSSGNTNLQATSANTASFTAVNKDKAITFLAMQGPGGQAGGESNYLPTPNPDADDLGAFNGLLDFNGGGTQVSVARTIPVTTNIAATYSVYVVTFDP